LRRRAPNSVELLNFEGEAMSGFLYDIQGYFKATYSGRYLAFILTELYRQDREAFIRILNEAGINYIHKTGDRAVANCWPFPIATQLRFADIAILNAADDPIVLVEIKDADINNEGNTAQLDHYLKFIGNKKNRNVEFLFLSRTVPPEKDEQKLQTARSKKRVHQMFFRQLHNPLRGSKVFGKMLMDYLEGINVAYFERRPDQNTIRYVTNSMLGIGGQKVIEKSMPEFYQIAFGNLSSLGLWIQNNNPKLFKRGFKRRLYVEPWHDVRRLKADITAKSQKKAAALMKDESLDEYCKGGKVYIYTCGYLTHKNGRYTWNLAIGWKRNKNRQSRLRTSIKVGYTRTYCGNHGNTLV
jgi:hypothetical protein